jgi:hypothetical protein
VPGKDDSFPRSIALGSVNNEVVGEALYLPVGSSLEASLQIIAE